MELRPTSELVPLPMEEGLFETFPMGLLVVDGSGRVLRANPAGKGLLGPLEGTPWVLGGRDRPILASDLRPLAPEEFPWARALRDGKALPEVLLGVSSPAGRVVWLTLNATPLDQERALLACQGASEQHRFRALSAATTDGCLRVDLEGRLLEVNEAYSAMSGYTREELLGFRVSDLEAKEAPEETQAHIQRIVETGFARFQTWHRRKDASILEVEVSATFLREAGEFLVFLQDIGYRSSAEAELRLQAWALDQALDRVTVTDLEGRIIYVNQAQCAFLGQPRHSLLGRSVEGYSPGPEGVEAQRRILEGTLERGEWRGEVQTQGPDGRTSLVDLRTSLIRDPEGRPLAMVGVGTDITERRRAEDELAGRETRYRQLVESTKAIPWEFDLETLRFTYVAPQAEALFGHPIADWYGEGFWPAHIHPEDRDWAVSYCMACSGRLEEHEFDYRFMTAEGKALWVRDVVSVFAEGNRPKALRGVMINITDQKQAELALMEHELKYRTLFERVGDYVLVVEPRPGGMPVIVDFNEAALAAHGYTREELMGQPMTLLDPDLTPGVVAERMGSMGEAGLLLEACHRRKDGSRFDVEVRLSPFQLAGRTLLLGVERDITDRKRAEAALAESEARFRQLFEGHAVPMLLVEPESGAFMDVNPAAEVFYGYSRKTFRTFHVWDVNVLPEKRVRERLEECLVRKETQWISDHRLACGEIRTVEVHSSPIQVGGRNFLFSIIVDISKRVEAQEALRTSEAKLREAQNLARLGWWEQDHRSGKVTWSEELYRVHGLDPHGSPPDWKAFQERIHPDDRPRMVERFEEHLKGGRALSGHYRIQLPGGEVRHLRTFIRTEFSPEGQALRSFGTDQDVTEQVLAEAERQRTVSLLEATLESTADGILVVDHQGQVQGFNHQFQQMWRLPQALLDRHEDGALLSFVLDQVEDPSSFLEKVEGLYAHPGEECFDVIPFKDGRVFERYSCPQRLGGEIVGRVWSFRDVTQGRRAEEERRSSEEKFQRAFRGAPLMMTLTRLEDGTLLEVNDRFCTLSGFSREECLGKTTLDLGWIHPEDRRRLVSSLDPEGRVRNLEMNLHAKDGRAIPSLFSAEVLQVGGEALLISMATDISERVLAEEQRRALETQLHHLQRMESVGRLAGGIAHDMNNVLAGIMALATLLQGTGDPDASKWADLILDASLRGRNLVKGLMEFARKEVKEVEPVDLNEVVRKEAEILANTTLQRVHIEQDLEPDLPPVTGSLTGLSTALMNLCVNAVDAMPEGGRLGLRTRRAGDGQVSLVVEDSGLGMPPEVLSRAMEPFFTTKPAGKGTGLGLSVVFGTVQAHGGTLVIHSEPGKGTRVEVTLPVRGGPRLLPSSATLPAPASGASLNLLVVDDDPLILETTPALLESLGHRVEAANGGRAALSLLEKGGEWDAVLLDMNMPGMDGVETLRRFRALAPSLPVLVVSGYLERRITDELERLGRVGILPKPYSCEEVEAALKVLLSDREGPPHLG
ncbi:MAG: PAS domain S-box protein [Acidobacteria bacterium]|nr:PAS domain S-box protein [Acidobacteriota bacterium]